MEAELVEELPTGDWQYEPKWDGFRGVLENDGGELALWSRNGRPLLRYFPELEPLGKLLPPHSALDGEIVISKKGQLDFDSMQMRLHPAESRIRKLSAEIPAQFIAFDILLWKGEPIHELPLEKRRKELERKAKRFELSPYSRELKDAERWLDRLEAAGLDGVVAKKLGIAYRPRLARRRRQGQEVQDRRLRDRRFPVQREGGGPDLDAAARPLRRRRRARLRRPLLRVDRASAQAARGGAPEAARARLPERQANSRGQSRWTQGKELDWNPVRPELVCEVRYDKLEKNRFRHGTRFIRFRPDKDPEQCTWREVRPPRRRGDPTVESLLSDRGQTPKQKRNKTTSKRRSS